jgi:protein arginine N-methyltransferase 1
MRIEYHRTLIADHTRNSAFRSALARVIRPGETIVADIGAGTGLLGLMAAKLGARRVIMYESEAVAGVAREIVRANGLDRVIEIMPCHSTEMVDPPRADVIVSETLGNYALEENIIATLADARRRHMKPGGVMIPHRITQFVAPVTTPRCWSELTIWNELSASFDLDFAEARTLSLNNVYVRRFAPAEVLAAKSWDEIDLMRETRSNRSGEARWTASAATVIHGFALWWDAELTDGVALSTGPEAAATHWEQLYLPVLAPIHLAEGEHLGLSVRSKSSYDAGTNLAWTVTATDASGKKNRVRQALDLDKGYLP